MTETLGYSKPFRFKKKKGSFSKKFTSQTFLGFQNKKKFLIRTASLHLHPEKVERERRLSKHKLLL